MKTEADGKGQEVSINMFLYPPCLAMWNRLSEGIQYLRWPQHPGCHFLHTHGTGTLQIGETMVSMMKTEVW